MIETQLVSSEPEGGSYYWQDDKPCRRIPMKLSQPGPFRVQVGESFVRDPVTHQGDHVHALPYWYKKTVLPAYNKHVVTLTEYRTTVGCKDEPIYAVHQYDVGPRACITQAEIGLVKPQSTSVKFNVRSSAIIKAQADLRKQMASLPMLFMERKATVKTIGKYSKFILNNAITMQRKDVKRWLKAIKRQSSPEKLKTIAQQTANKHLEFVFGVMPLIDDLHGLTEFFAEKRVNVRTGNGRHRQKAPTRNTLKERVSHGSRMYINSETSYIADYSVRCKLRMTISSHIANDASKLGFNPIYTWYDATPLSFIVGWFSNLNTWLRTLDPITGLQFETGHISTREQARVERKISISSFKPDKPVTVSNGQLTSIAEYTDFEREALSELPGLQMPSFQDNASLFAAFASVSLLVQRYVKSAEREISAKPFRYRGPKPKFLKPIRFTKPT